MPSGSDYYSSSSSSKKKEDYSTPKKNQDFATAMKFDNSVSGTYGTYNGSGRRNAVSGPSGGYSDKRYDSKK